MAGSVAVLVALVGDERVTPLQLLLAFGGGFAIGSRPIVLTVDQEVN